MLVAQLYRRFTIPWTVAHQLLCSWDSPGKNTGVDCHSFLQGIFSTQGLNPGLLHCGQILYHLSHLINRKVQINLTARFYLTPVRMAIIKKTKKNITNVVKDVEKREPLCTFDKNVNWCRHYGKQYGIPQKNWEWNYYTIQLSHFCTLSKDMKAAVPKDTHTFIYVYRSPASNSWDTGAT